MQAHARPRRRTIRLDGAIANDPDVAAEVVRALIRRSSQERLMLVAIHVHLRHVDLDLDLPATLRGQETEQMYLENAGRLFVAAVTKEAVDAALRVGSPLVE